MKDNQKQWDETLNSKESKDMLQNLEANILKQLEEGSENLKPVFQKED